LSGLDRLVVTGLGLGLVAAVNLYFFSRPRDGRVQSATPPADTTGEAGGRPGLTATGHEPPDGALTSKER
jgi:hypothetical protein